MVCYRQEMLVLYGKVLYTPRTENIKCLVNYKVPLLQ